MLQSGSPHMRATASALTQAAAIAIDGPIRGKTAHKKIPKLANDRDTNVIGGGGCTAGIGLRRGKPIASWRSLGWWTEATVVQSLLTPPHRSPIESSL